MSFKTVFTNAEFELLKEAQTAFAGCELAIHIGENAWRIQQNDWNAEHYVTYNRKKPNPTWQIGMVFVEQLPSGDWQVHTDDIQRVYFQKNMIRATYALELLLARKRIAELEEAVYYACDGEAYQKIKQSFDGSVQKQESAKRKRMLSASSSSDED